MCVGRGIILPRQNLFLMFVGSEFLNHHMFFVSVVKEKGRKDNLKIYTHCPHLGYDMCILGCQPTHPKPPISE